MTAPKLITSLTNDRVKAIRALEMRKERKDTGLFVAEGASLILTAAQHAIAPETLVFQTGTATSGAYKAIVDTALSRGAEVLEVSPQVLEKLSSKDNPQTLLGVFKQRWGLAPVPKSVAKDACWLVLEEVRDPGNLGTIIRTADAAGVAGIVLVGNCCDAYAHDTVRATMGSIFAVPLIKMSREDFLAWRSGWPGDIVGTHLSAREDFRAATYHGPVMLVMGSEGPGLSDSLTRACTRLVKIPMAGDLDSLNLAVATALVLYQVQGGSLRV